MRPRSFSRRAEWLITFPSLAWLTFFFLVPTLWLFAIAFKPADLYGGIGAGWTWATWRRLANPHYLRVAWRTLWLSAATTGVCLLAALPCGYHVARASPRWKSWLLMLIVIPFWTSFLVRIFAWKVLLHPDGLLKQVLVRLGWVHPDTSLLYRPAAVLMVLIYTYLPFAILPIFAAAEKFDFTLIEAARDLGATRWQAFRRVFLPGIRRALATAALVVFIPALGSYVIPDLVGGPQSEMLGNKIAQRTFVDRDLPHASALSAALTLAVLLPMLWVLLSAARRGEGLMGRRPPALPPAEAAP